MLSETARLAIRPFVPEPVLEARRRLLRLRSVLQTDGPLLRFKYTPRSDLTFAQRSSLIQRVRAAHEGIRCPHTHAEMDRLIRAILDIPPSTEGCIVEAGCFKGGSTAKLSLAAKLVNRKLFVFDSFAGLPTHNETHDKTIFGEQTKFTQGLYTGLLDEVKDNVRQFGHLEPCEFIPGWFEDTMPHFKERVALAFIDVDLASSTRTCLQYLYPLLAPGASIYSHDGHLPLCIEAIDDDDFWSSTVGFPKPPMPDLRKVKLLKITKPAYR